MVSGAGDGCVHVVVVLTKCVVCVCVLVCVWWCVCQGITSALQEAQLWRRH